MEIYTIGFTKKSAEQFFGRLRDSRIQRLIDVRLNNTSQLAGFAKKDDLAFFLREVCGAEYLHEPLLAPAQAFLDDFKKHTGSWEEYERRFLALMSERSIERVLDPSVFEPRTVLLCSELEATHCHRRLIAEYLRDKWGGVEIVHL